jgi:Xaa-Pro dipeptidase
LKLAEIQRALREEHLDGWLFYDHHGRDPLAYRVLGLPLASPSRRWFYFIPVQGEPKALVHRIEPAILNGLPGNRSVYSGWRELEQNLRPLLAGAQRVAMQYSPENRIPVVSLVDAGTVELVRALGVDVASSANLIQLFEATWTEAQQRSHFEAGRLVDEVRHSAFEFIRESLKANRAIDEYHVQRFILDGFARNGLTTNHGPIVAVNANASNPHYEPAADNNSPIRKGDLVLIDLWAKFDRPDAVYYDITWTGVCTTSPSSAVQNVFEVVTKARDLGVQAVQKAKQSGTEISGYEVDDVARQFIADQGFGPYFVHRLGHSIGTEVHGAGANLDNLESHDERRLIANTCFSVEPGVYLPEFGIRSEVNVLCSERDAVVTGEIQRQLLTLL